MNMLLALSTYVGSFDLIRFLIGFVLMVCVIAIVIILLRWLASLAGLTVPQPLLLVVSILLFLVLFLMLMSWSGLYRF